MQKATDRNVLETYRDMSMLSSLQHALHALARVTAAYCGLISVSAVSASHSHKPAMFGYAYASYMGMWQVYLAAYTAPGGGLDVLDELLEGRRELAGLLGAPSWSHYQVVPWLQDGMTCQQCTEIYFIRVPIALQRRM